MNSKRAKAEEKLIQAAEELLEQEKADAIVLRMNQEGDDVVAAGDPDVLPAVIPAAVQQAPKALNEMSPEEQQTFLENTPAELRDEVKRQMRQRVS